MNRHPRSRPHLNRIELARPAKTVSATVPAYDLQRPESGRSAFAACADNPVRSQCLPNDERVLMVKWIKRVLLGVAVILAVMIVVSAWGWWRLRAKPDWYKLSTATAEQREAAAARVENKFIAAQNWVAAARAREARALQNTPGARTPAQ